MPRQQEGWQRQAQVLNLRDVIDGIIDQILRGQAQYRYPKLRRKTAEELLDRTLGFLFPHFRDCIDFRDCLRVEAGKIQVLLQELLSAVHQQQDQKEQIINDYIRQLPSIGSALQLDAEFLAEGDPAAKSLDEVILAYPGFFGLQHIEWLTIFTNRGYLLSLV